VASIAIITAVTGDARPVEFKTAVESTEGGSHTATIVDDADIDTHDFTVYDVVSVIRGTFTSSTIPARIRVLTDTENIPVLLSVVESGITAGTGRTVIPTTANLIGTAVIYNTAQLTDITDATHEITDAYGTGDLRMSTSAMFGGAVDTGQSETGDDLAQATSTGDARTELLAIESGTLDLVAVEIGARVVISGEIHSSSYAYATSSPVGEGRELIADIITWLLASAPPGGGGGGTSVALEIDNTILTNQPTSIEVFEAPAKTMPMANGGVSAGTRAAGAKIRVTWGIDVSPTAVLAELRAARGGTASHQLEWDDVTGTHHTVQVAWRGEADYGINTAFNYQKVVVEFLEEA